MTFFFADQPFDRIRSLYLNLRCVALVAVVATVFVAVGVKAETPKRASPRVTISRLMEHMGFHPSLKEGLLNGKVLSTGMPEMEKLSNELAVSAVMLVVRRPMREVIKAYLDGATFRLDPDIIDHKLIANDLNSGPKAEAAFRGIHYTSGESSEIQKLLKASAGTTFNLNLAEIKQRLQFVLFAWTSPLL